MLSLGIVARIIASYLFRVFPVKNNKIFFSNFDGKGYGDNPKYICEGLIDSGYKYDIVWELDDFNETLPDNIRKVRHNSFSALFESVTAKVWIDNYRKNIWFRKRKGQLYIQTWHAGIGFKKAENAVANSLAASYIERAKHDSKMADLFLSGSNWETDKYAKYYWYDGPILMTGVPKQDALANLTKNEIIEIKKRLHINEEVRIALYAPTFRKDMQDYAIYCLNWDRILNVLESKFGGKWIGAIRLHPGLARKDNDFSDMQNVIDFSLLSDAQEALAISDILITDYSSIVFDYVLTRNPVFLYALDLDEYRRDRDVFFDLKKLPFTFSESEEELEQSILGFDLKKYKTSLSSFLNDTCGLYPCGHATNYVCSIINNYVQNKNPFYMQELVASREES